MYYSSTRGVEEGVAFQDAATGGYTSDNGLYMPAKIPQFNLAKFAKYTAAALEEEQKRVGEKKKKGKESSESKEDAGERQSDVPIHKRSIESLYSYPNIVQYVLSLFIFENEIDRSDLTQVCVR